MPRHRMIDGVQIPFTPEEEAARDAEEKAWEDGAPARALEKVQAGRLAAYAVESDPVFFSWQAGETEKQVWLDARQAVKAAHPKPE